MYRFIENIGDFFNPGYYNEDFINKVFEIYGKTDTAAKAVKDLNGRFTKLRTEYYKVKGRIKDLRLHRKYIIKETHDFNSLVMEALGYDTSPAYANWINVDDSSVIPARSILYSGSKPSLVVLEMQAMIKTNDEDVPAGLFEQHYDDEVSEKVVREQQYRFNQWASVIGHELPEGCKISPSKINECVSAIFLLPEDQRPKYIVIFAGNIVFLMEQDKWDRGSYLKFDLEELFTEVSVAANKNYYALFYLLAAKEVLAKDGEIVLMDRIADESFKNAYEVTKDLKEGVINAVERLANEAIYYKRNILQEEFDETQESFAANVKDDCLSIIYRLLFIFYAEARPEIGILPMDDEAYAKGYSLEILRDLEQTPLKSKSAQDSYFFHDSLWQLFSLISKGYNDNSSSHRSFTVKRIDSPLFNDDKFKALKGVKYRNKVWQEIICDLSLSREQARKRRGRISYANLGVNQLGSVYESLLAYRGFYAEEDYIEVHPVGDTVETYLVPRSRMGDFNDDEILRDKNGETVILKKGSFVYRLNGRDRKKSASYYTPEVLTKSTVKYTLLGFKEKLDKGEMKVEELLNMKILEPAMGAAAFQNEVINQIAEMYLTYRQQELNKRIPPQDYQDERQKVKAYIATKNIYGVDLNPTAIELGKLALWLNVMHKDMETPFFAHRLALGNAVIGAWFKAYDVDEIYKKGKRLNTYECTSWWEKAPHRLHFSKERKKILRKSSEIYHFLLPDKNMLAALQIREEKIAHPEAARAMQAKKNNWTRAITAEDVLILKKISGKIDRLISECIAYQEKIEKLTGNNYKVWGHNSYVNAALFSYLDKEAVTNTRLATTSAYRKLVAVMDYWCALWFWEYEDTEKLPTREEFWIDIENILGVDLSTGVIKRDDDVLQLTSPQEPDLFNQDLFAQESRPATEEEQLDYVEDYVANAPEPKYTKEDAEKMILSASGHGTLFTTPRSDIVQRLSDRYHFFHPMLEFIEVFWLRDGFDVIVGNPPWVKLQFNEQGIISDTNPEVVIRSTSAPEIREKIQEFLKNETLSSLYYSELQETTCSSAFLNAPQNYSLLAGQQTNLYKCVLTNCFDTASDNGYIGLLHPDGVYDDSHGQVLRKEIYHRLVYHFQYVNVLKLFAEILHWVKYSTNVYGRRKESICFKSISNLYHPATVDGCFVHDGSGQCGGLKDNDDNWNTSAHKDRIVNYSDNELGLLSKTFEEDTTYDEAKLVCIQANSIINILSKIADFPTHVSDFGFKISSGFHETGSVDKGILKPKTSYGNPEEYGMVFKGPQFSICTPWYKNPNEHCKNQHDYSVVRLTDISPSFYTRSNFSPVLPIKEYRELIDGLPISVDQQGKDVYDSWIDHYKLAFRSQLSQPQERTLICAVLPRKTAH
ncbi:MAG: type II restriction endonuclease subunit M, partial [Bacteroidales bacterium]|nr:type II restriction endonuclease subunit M [Bacteroidales bacterium]